MCEVATAIAVGAAVVGTYMQQQGQARREDAAAAATIGATNRDAERERNNRNADAASRDRASARETTARNAVLNVIPEAARETMDTSMEGAANERRAAYDAAAPAETAYLPGQGGGPAVVRDAVDRERAKGRAELGTRADALATLGSWGDALGGLRRSIGRAGEEAGFQGMYGRGDQSLEALRAQTDATLGRSNDTLARAAMLRAGTAGAGLRTAGNATVALGTAAAPYASGAISGLFAPTPNVPKNKPAAL